MSLVVFQNIITLKPRPMAFSVTAAWFHYHHGVLLRITWTTIYFQLPLLAIWRLPNPCILASSKWLSRNNADG